MGLLPSLLTLLTHLSPFLSRGVVARALVMSQLAAGLALHRLAHAGVDSGGRGTWHVGRATLLRDRVRRVGRVGGVGWGRARRHRLDVGFGDGFVADVYTWLVLFLLC